MGMFYKKSMLMHPVASKENHSKTLQETTHLKFAQLLAYACTRVQLFVQLTGVAHHLVD